MKSEDGVKYPLVNYVVSAENMVGSIIEAAAKILLYVGIGVFVFAVILFMTYISASISYKNAKSAFYEPSERVQVTFSAYSSTRLL